MRPRPTNEPTPDPCTPPPLPRARRRRGPDRPTNRPREWPPGAVERAAWLSLFVLGLALLFAIHWAIPVGLAIGLGGAAHQAGVLSGAFGTARFARTPDLRSADLLHAPGLILGRWDQQASVGQALGRLFTRPWSESLAVCRYLRAALTLRDEPEPQLIRYPRDRFVHAMVVAPPGAGKGVGFVIPNLLTHRGSTVAIDPKGELFWRTARVRRRRLGHRVVRLDPLGECGPGGDRFNPLQFINPRDPMVGEQCQALADALVVQTGHEHDPHWNESAKLGIAAAILYVVAYGEPEERHLSAVAELLTDPTAFEGMVAIMRDESGAMGAEYGATHAYRLLRRYGGTMAAWRERELSSILSSMGRHLAWLHSPLVEAHLAESSFDPRDLVRERMTVYLVLPPKHLTTLSRLMRLWITAIYGAVTEGGPQEERTVLFLLDEVGNLGPMQSLYQAITLGRGYGIRVALVLQALGQLKTLFPKDGEHQAVEASIDLRLFFGIRDYASAEALSNYLGQTTVQVVSRTEGKSRGTTWTGSLAMSLVTDAQYSKSRNVGTSTSATESETGRKLLMPDEILQLASDQALILVKEVPPILARLAKYYEVQELADRAAEAGPA